jgi:hypothetical protein
MLYEVFLPEVEEVVINPNVMIKVGKSQIDENELGIQQKQCVLIYDLVGIYQHNEI